MACRCVLTGSDSEGGVGKGSEMTVNEANNVTLMWHVDCMLARSNGEGSVGKGSEMTANEANDITSM